MFAPVILAAAVSFSSLGLGDPDAEVPKDAEIVLKMESSEYFLGETVAIHCVLKNNGSAPFKVLLGGGGIDRPPRYQMTVTDPKGNVLEDPSPFQQLPDEMYPVLEVKPDEEVVETVPLLRFCEIVRPGRYKVAVTHDYGWVVKERKLPVGKTTVTFRMPSEKEAAEVLDRMEKLPERRSVIGRPDGPYAEFQTLRLPIYLKPLIARAEQGNLRAITGIGSIATKEATNALIRLASDLQDEAAVLQAAKELNERLPVTPSMRQWISPRQKRLIERAWDPAKSGKVAAIGVKLLKSPRAEEIAQGARMLELIGRPEDAPVVVEAIRGELERLQTPRSGTGDLFSTSGISLKNFLQIMRNLHERGLKPGDLPQDARLLLTLDWLANVPGPRSPEWLEEFKTAVGSPSHVLRQTAIRSIPAPMPRECAPVILEALRDPDLGVRAEAYKVAGASGDHALIPVLVEEGRKLEHEGMVLEISNALFKLGAGFEAREVIVERMGATEGDFFTPFHSLIGSLTEPMADIAGEKQMTKEEWIVLRDRWKAFLSQNEKAIREGRKFNVSDPELRPDMVEPGFRLHFDDGTSWPAEKPAGASKGD